MKYLPNIISASRGISALAMLYYPAFSPGFWALYCWGGVSDMIDGPIARKLNSVSETGSRIDSGADLVFVICSAIKVLPSIQLPVWIWLWVAAIGAVKMAGIVIGSARNHKLSIPHSASNRLTGVLLFCMPVAMIWLEPAITSIIVCAAASYSVFNDIQLLNYSVKP